MKLNVNKKQEEKIIAKYVRILDNIALMNPTNSEDNFILWCSGIDIDSKKFRRIVNAKKGEINKFKKNFKVKYSLYIKEHVLRTAWRKHWDKE